jgi:hypothetical protein
LYRWEHTTLVELSQLANPGIPVDELPPIMAIGFYGDESEATGKVFTLAGFMAAPTGWDHFIPKWREMLCNTGPYPVDAFHSADIEAAKPPFDGWPIEARRKLVDNAVDLLCDTDLCGNLYAVACTFVIPDFHAMDPTFLGNIAKTYEWAYRVLLHNILATWVFNGYEFYFDEKEKVKGRVEKHFNDSKASLDKNPAYAGKLSNISWRDDRKVIPLQAADLLAYEIRRHTWTRLERGEVPMRSAYQRIKDTFAVSPEKPPYRQRLFRCYDRRFVDSVLSEMHVRQQDHELTETEVIDLWYLHDAPED